MQTTAPPRVEDPSAELDALIEEARQRARRRRLALAGAVAAGAMALGAVLLFGGGGEGDGSSGGTGPGDEGSAGTGPQSSGSASAGYQCPTSPRELRELPPPGPGIPGCKVTVLAEVPGGWDQEPRSVVTFPPRTMGSLVPTSSHFASFGLGNHNRDLLRPAVRTIPDDGVLLSVTAGASGREVFPRGAEDLAPTSPDRTLAFKPSRIEVDGIEFTVEVRTGGGSVQPELADEIDAIIASLDTSQKLCPCGEHLNLPPATLESIDRKPGGQAITLKP